MSSIKKKRVSKKNKGSWRKHVNINDVEDFLQDKRNEERLLKKPLSEVPSDDFCWIDTKGVDAKPSQESILSKQEKRALLRSSLPKCFSALQNESQVTDPISKRNRVRTREERKSVFVKHKENLKRLQKPKVLKQNVGDCKLQKKAAVFSDIWNQEKKPDELLDNEWIGPASKRQILYTANQHQKLFTKHIAKKKQSGVPAVEIPHPGTSYNPKLEDHQDLLQQAVQKELKIIKEEEHLARVTTKMFKKVKASVRDENKLKEQSEGLNRENESESEEGEEQFSSLNPPVLNKKKTLKQRRKRREHVQELIKKERVIKEKKKIHDLRNLRILKKKLEEEQKLAEELKQKQIEALKNKPEETKRLTRLKFEEEEIYFNMPQDISGNLNNLKTEGNLLVNRFKSLQKRNILQPTTYRKMRSGKVKKYQKAGHQSDWKITIARPKENLL